MYYMGLPYKIMGAGLASPMSMGQVIRKGRSEAGWNLRGMSKAVFSWQNQSVSLCYPFSFLGNRNSLPRDPQLMCQAHPG